MAKNREENLQEQGFRPDLLRWNNGDQTEPDQTRGKQPRIGDNPSPHLLTMSRGDEAHRPHWNCHDPTKDSAFPHFLKQGDKANQTNSNTYKQVLIYRHPHGQRYNPSSLGHGREETQIRLAGRRRWEGSSPPRLPLSCSLPFLYLVEKKRRKKWLLEEQEKFV